jgi:hypothetical protein
VAAGANQEPVAAPISAAQVKIVNSLDVDIVYHCLAHLPLPGNPANLHSSSYQKQIQKAKQDLESGQTLLDQQAASLAASYQKFPHLEFLNLAPFMADDYASFKQAMQYIDLSEADLEEPDETLAQRRERDKNRPLLFGNARRLIPLLQKRFPDPAERQFLKEFSACMEDEFNRFYRSYRESRQELDEAGLRLFQAFWETRGKKILEPWVERAQVTTLTLFLSPVMKSVGRGIPVIEGNNVWFNVVAPLPDSPDHALQSFFIVLHEILRRGTDPLVEASPPPARSDLAAWRDFAAFRAGHLYLQARYPSLDPGFLRFFLNLPPSNKTSLSTLENDFEKAYPVPAGLLKSLAELIHALPSR